VDVLAVPRLQGEAAREKLERLGRLDAGRVIAADGGDLLLPVTDRNGVDAAALGGTWSSVALGPRARETPPYERVLAQADLPASLKAVLPRKWERLGDIVLLHVPPELEPHRAAVGEAYGRGLAARTVAAYGPISGAWRQPAVEVLWGDGTETEHLENGIRYRLDVTRTMFSSGNLPERMRMGRVASRGETVVDLFAGIGYFTLPMAVNGGARIFACEVNPEAFSYLVQNARLNRAEGVTPLAGDCRQVAPRGVADRVVLGYLDGEDYLTTAMECFRGGGWLHYHEACPRDLCERRPMERVGTSAAESGLEVVEHRLHYLKSYAPNVWHIVLDARLEGQR